MPDPPALGLLVGAVGKTLVVAGAGAFLLSALASFSHRKGVDGRSLATVCFWVGVACTCAVFAVHIGLILGARYEFAYVYENSDNSMPFVFRLSAAWAAQEGSFLLWIFMSAVTGAVLLRLTGPYKRWFLAAFGAVMALKLGILAYESPFQLLDIDSRALQSMTGATSSAVPADGLGLNPVLQNLWMVIHPLLIFAGFGALTPLFCWSVSAAVSDDWHTWAVLARPFAIVTTTLLGLGLVLGGLWAYETLGWGGFWAWDPVENAALVPWIATVVLMHGLLIQVNRGRWVRLNIFLGALPFVWFVYGTFLTRSGVLADVSVHSFAEMNEGAHGMLLWTLRIALLSLLFGTGFVLSRSIYTKAKPPATLEGHSRPLLVVGGALVVVSVIALWLTEGTDSAPVLRVSGVLALSWLGVYVGVWTGKRAKPAVAEIRTDAPGQRTVWMNAGVATLYVIGVATAIGMSFPFLANIFGEQAWVVSEASYNEALVVPFIIVMALIGAAPFLGWTNTAPGRFKRLAAVAAVSLVLTAVPVWIVFSQTPGGTSGALPICLPIWVCVFAAVANATRAIERMKAKSGGTGAFLV
ncbi:MAG: cytochrome c biogenesis protein CcsA, partial [Armatimonadetes bacterium]|nr:cytochrome c biogenesis protein CcsA [Armatimonadota bacterium]